jgi:hypothetical protein
LVGQNAGYTVDLKGKIVAINLMPPPHYSSWSLAISLYRFCQSAGKRTPQPWCCCYHFVADDTVESLYFIYGFHYQEGSYGIEDGKSSTAATVPLSWQVSS